MSLSPEFLDELRVRTTLSTLVARSMKLAKAGREMKGCCPFHNEKTPSFYVNDEKGFYHCFGCGAHGDAIRWLTDNQGLPFIDAVKELADAAGMELPAPDPRAGARIGRAKGLHEALQAAADWFETQLGGIDGAEARAYLDQRGVGDATRRKFAIGFAPDSRGKLRTALRDFTDALLIEAGLLIQPEGDREPYDRFRGRLMIPIRDPRGRVIAFGGRILGPGEPKYLNSPDTPVFDKGRTLFNLDRAAAVSRNTGRLIVVEGYMDVIALDQAGIGDAVAPLGTAVTEGQLDRMWRLVPDPILCLDGDAAGIKAGVRAAARALPAIGPSRSLRFVALPEGQDPDDLLRAKGRPAIETLLNAAETLVDRLWRHEQAAEPLTTPEKRAGLRERLMDHVAAIGDGEVREQYRAEFLSRYRDLTRPAQAKWTAAQPKWSRPSGPRFAGRRDAAPRPASPQVRALGQGVLAATTASAVLAGLLRYPDLIASHAEAVAALPVAGHGGAALRDRMLDIALAKASLDPEGLATILAAEGMAARIEEHDPRNVLAFSFNRRDADPERARHDLVLAIDTLAARPGLDAALDAATARLRTAGDEAAFAEQQRLRAARDEADMRLATLMESAAEVRD